MVTEFIKYTGAKTIKAMPMGAAEAKRYGANITKDAINKNLGNNGYLVEYPDGYRSWSPAKQFEEAYRVSETYLDTLRIDLYDLKKKIKIATEMLYNHPLDTPRGGRNLLEMQLKAMFIYADVLVKRIQAITDEQVRKDNQVCSCTPKAAEGGEL